jgi:CDP-diacylglycerol--serine O-phosphatidyltransferase
MGAIAANAVTMVRVPLGAAALIASLGGNLTAAATLITICAVLDGVDGKVARWLSAATPFGALFDYFCDYLCFVVAPWALTRALVDAGGGLVDALLVVPLVTGAARYARSGVIVAGRNPRGDEVRDLPGLATMFFAFVGVVAVFLDVRSVLAPQAAVTAVVVMAVAMSLLMVAPVRYPKLTAFPGVSPTVLVLLAAMPVVGTQMIAAAALVIGLAYVVAGPLLVRHAARVAVR